MRILREIENNLLNFNLSHKELFYKKIRLLEVCMLKLLKNGNGMLNDKKMVETICNLHVIQIILYAS